MFLTIHFYLAMLVWCLSLSSIYYGLSTLLGISLEACAVVNFFPINMSVVLYLMA